MYTKKSQLVSSEGKLDTSLTVDINEYTIDWLTVKRRMYNDEYTGPTIRVKAGDKVNLNLVSYMQKKILKLKFYNIKPYNLDKYNNKT